MSRYSSRKFFLATVYTAAGIVGLFYGVVTGGEYAALAATVLGMYSAANVWEKRG